MALDLDTVGSLLFGSTHRLRLAVWVMKRDLAFYQHEIGDDHGKTTEVAGHLQRLTVLGMVEPCERVPGDRRAWWRKLESPLWDCVAAAETAVSSQTVG